MVKINYRSYIIFEKFLGLACGNVTLMPVNMEARNRLLLDLCIPLCQYPTHKVVENRPVFCYRPLATLYYE